MTTRNKRTLVLIIVILVVLIYASPYWTVHQMEKAVHDRDAAALSHYVDFPAVKESLKAGLSAQLNQKIGGEKGNNPLVALGMAMAGAVLNPFLDALVSPEGLATMLSGNKPDPINPQAPADRANHQEEPNVTKGYESLNRFVIQVSPKEKPNQKIDFVFQREGLLSWRLTTVRFPDS